MKLISLLSAPLIGAVIGYCTNYIAVKMLFRPIKPIIVCGKTLPFTPGIIPKRKPALARAIGQAVGTSLVGEEEIAAAFKSEGMKQAVVGSIANAVEEVMTTNTVKQAVSCVVEENEYDKKRTAVTEAVTDKIISGITSMDISEIIVREGSAAIRGKGGMIAMFVNDDMIRGFAGPISERVEAFLEQDGRTLIYEKVNAEVCATEEKQLSELISMEDNHVLCEKIGECYDSLIGKEAAQIVGAFDIQGIVENKINEMDVKELEELIMSVMKNELGMIVNLGALIGFILGLANLFF